jgi:hypothetical protein
VYVSAKTETDFLGQNRTELKNENRNSTRLGGPLHRKAPGGGHLEMPHGALHCLVNNVMAMESVREKCQRLSTVFDSLIASETGSSYDSADVQQPMIKYIHVKLTP